jgi:hypothetical protein
MKVLKIKENKDGSATVTYELDKQEEIILRQHAENRGKKYSKKFVNDCILEGIINMLREEEMKKPFVVKKEVKRRINKQIKHSWHYIISDGKNAIDGDTLK